MNIGQIQDWFDKRKSQRHEELKKEIEIMKVNRNFLMGTKAPQFMIDKADKKIKRLEKKLVRRI